MSKKRPTLQKTLAVAILLIGVIGIALVIATDYAYRELAYEQQRDSVSQLISVKSADLIKKLADRQKSTSFKLQDELYFQQAFATENKQERVYWLNLEFNRYYSTMDPLRHGYILIYDDNFQLITSSARGISNGNNAALPCPNIISHLKTASVAQHSKASSQLCENNNQTLLSTVLPIGNIKTKGYINIITNPAYILSNIETELGVPLRIYNQNHELLHQSNSWPVNSTTQNHLVSPHLIYDKNNNVSLYLYAASDITAFKTQLNNTRYKIIFAATALTLLTLLIAFIILRRGLLPLINLRHAADNSAYGDLTPVNETGYIEISAPIHAFNTMVGRIRSLITDLKTEVEEHELTEEKFKQAKENAEQSARHAKHQSNFLRMTLHSIVDGVITTTIDGLVQSMNPMAEQLTGWKEAEATGKPLVKIMHALNETTHKRIYNPIENIAHKSVLDKPVNAILIQNHSDIETPIEYIAAPMRSHNDEIAGIVIIIHDESIQRTLNRQLTFQATHDALTGLINRYEFERRLKTIISTQIANHSINTLCCINLEQFKFLNDTCGHTAGDELLKQITLLLQNNIESIGVLARLDSDEFSLLLENCDVEKAQELAAHLLSAIQQFHFTWNGNTFTVGASIGIAPISHSITSCEEILSNADSACYLARESGHNQIQVFTKEDDKFLTQQREMHWISRINHALEEDRFRLYFQEIIPLDGHGQSFILHGEVLLRMIDKEGDIVSPGNFLPAAERYNMIILIDEWVIDKSIQWLASRKEKVLISVNLSGMSISDKDFLNFVVSKIKQHEINPELLCFEITETAAISHLNTAIHFMNVLKKLGCSFALDDFGSGLSSFSYLTSLPVDYLKIDGSFVMDIDKDPMHYAMVKSINEVGQVMGIKTIAEFATSEEIIRCLKEIGVDNAQGYAVARPIPLASLSTDASKPFLSAVKND